jgi:hypothetical protein
MDWVEAPGIWEWTQELDGKILFVQHIKDRTTECFDDLFSMQETEL